MECKIKMFDSGSRDLQVILVSRKLIITRGEVLDISQDSEGENNYYTVNMPKMYSVMRTSLTREFTAISALILSVTCWLLIVIVQLSSHCCKNL